MIRGTYRKGDAVGSTLKPFVIRVCTGYGYTKIYTERFQLVQRFKNIYQAGSSVIKL
jgi:hypothetical protein